MLEALAAKFAGSLGAGLGEAIGGGGGPFVGGAATAGAYGTTLDGSGWIVNLGGTQIASASPTRTVTDPGAAAPIQAGINPLAMLLLAGAAVVWYLRKGRT